MIGIEEIAKYIPESRIENLTLSKKFDFNVDFIKDKIGVEKVSRKSLAEDSSDLAVNSYNKLKEKCGFEDSEIKCLILVTQNPDYVLPHTSAVVHGKLKLSKDCACFDISLGCSGYVYALSVVKSFMESNSLDKGVLITSDPYSKIIDSNDRNTSLLFGDASSATLLSSNPVFEIMKFTFGTSGQDYKSLINNNGTLFMNGRSIFNFVAKKVPIDIKRLFKINNIEKDQIDKFIFHQGSKYIIDTIVKRLDLNHKKVPFLIGSYGNTVSSSIPIILEEFLTSSKLNLILLSGFGVGLSWSSVIIKKINK